LSKPPSALRRIPRHHIVPGRALDKQTPSLRPYLPPHSATSSQNHAHKKCCRPVPGNNPRPQENPFRSKMPAPVRRATAAPRTPALCPIVPHHPTTAGTAECPLASKSRGPPESPPTAVPRADSKSSACHTLAATASTPSAS